MTLQYDPHPESPFCGYGRRKPPWWEPWAVLGLWLLVIVIGRLIGGR